MPRRKVFFIATSKPFSASSSNFSVAKLLRIIEIMAFEKKPLRLQEIAHSANMPQSTVSRFLAALVNAGYATQNEETMKYQLTLKFCRIGNAIHSQFSIRDICKPYLMDLSQKCCESAYVSVEENMAIVYLDSAEGSSNTLTTQRKTGWIASMHATAAGKVLLLNYSSQLMQKYLDSRGLPQLTMNTITDKEQLLITLEHIRSDGFAIDDEENEIGVRCVAAPVYDYEEKIIAAISVSGPTSRMNYQKINHIKDYVIATAADISRILGYRAPLSP